MLGPRGREKMDSEGMLKESCLTSLSLSGSEKNLEAATKLGDSGEATAFS